MTIVKEARYSMNTCEEEFSGRIDTPYHHSGPFADERARYLAHLLKRGWARATVIGTAASWPPLRHVLISTARVV